MIIVGCVIGLLCFGTILFFYAFQTDRLEHPVGGIAMGTTIISGIVLLIMLVAIVDANIKSIAQIAEYQTLKDTVEKQPRSDALQQVYGQAITMNRQIAQWKVYARNQWIGIFAPSELAALEPIKIPEK